MTRQALRTKVMASLIAFALAVPTIAFARTQHAASGYPASATGVGCWDNSGAVMTNICAGTFAWVMPVSLDTGGVKTIAVTAQVLAGGTLTCNVSSFKPDGTQQTGFPVAFGAFSSTLSTVPLVVNITAGNTVLVGCTGSGGSKARILGLDYTP